MFNLQAHHITALHFTPLLLHVEVAGQPGPQAPWRDLPGLRETVGELLLHWLDPNCRDSAGHLLEELTACRLVAGELGVSRRNRADQQAPLPDQVWLDLCLAVEACPDPVDRRSAQVVEKVSSLLEREILEFRGTGPHMNARVLEELLLTLNKVQNAVPGASLEASWEHYQQLERMVVGPATSRTPMLLNPLEMGEAGQSFLHQLLITQDSALQSALAAAEPVCTRCGECCRRFAVEIQPSDITRLSGHLGLSYRQFVEDYTGPGQFSWNLEARTLNKQGSPGNSRFQLQLAVVDEMDCVFLQPDQQDGLHYCAVHSHRPDICRNFEPSNQLCRDVNHRAHPDRQAENLDWVQVTDCEVRVQTHRRSSGSFHPLVLTRSRWPHLDQAARQLERASESPR